MIRGRIEYLGEEGRRIGLEGKALVEILEVAPASRVGRFVSLGVVAHVSVGVHGGVPYQQANELLPYDHTVDEGPKKPYAGLAEHLNSEQAVRQRIHNDMGVVELRRNGHWMIIPRVLAVDYMNDIVAHVPLL